MKFLAGRFVKSLSALTLSHVFIPSALAGQSSSRSVQITHDTTRPSGFGMSIFAGADGAILKTSPSDSDESAKRGALYGGKILLNVNNKDLEIESGMGYVVSQLQGSNDIVQGDDPGSLVQLDNVRIQTKTAVAEFNARLKLNSGALEGDAIWSVGPSAAAFMGTNASFGPDTKKLYRSAIFLGGQLALEFGGEIKPRLVLSYLTDVNLFERQVHIGLLSLQFGAELFSPKTIVKDIRRQTSDEIITKIPVEKHIEHTVFEERVRFLLDSEMVNFETDKAVLLKKSEIFIRELGLVLAQNSERWSSLMIEGHTDARGSLEHNNRLSFDRASTVRNALLRAGVPATRIKALGYGPSRPIDPTTGEVAWARNRRVELNFEGVKDPQWLRNIMQKLKTALSSSRR